MPIVPRVDVPRVDVAPLPGARITGQADASAGLALAGAYRQVADAAKTIFQKEKAKADDTALLNARQQLADWENQQFDPHNADGVYAKRGKDALALPDSVRTGFDATAAQIENGLTNDDQRLAFRKMAMQFGDQVMGRVQSYALQQNEQYMAATEKAAQQTFAERASTAAREGRFDAMTQEVQLAHDQIAAAGKRQGLPPEAIEVKQHAFTSQTLLSAVQGMLDSGDYAGAVKFYHANADDMLEDDRARIDNAVRNADILDRATTESNTIIAQYGTGTTAVRQAEKIDDPVLRDHVVSAIDREAARRDRMQRDYERALKGQAYDAVFKADPATPVDKAIPPGVLSALDPQDIIALQAFQDRRLRGTATQTDPRVFERLSTLSPEQLAREDIDGYFARGQLSIDDRNHLKKQQDEILNPDPNKAPKWGSEASMFEEAFSLMGVHPTGNGDADKRGAFKTRYYAAERAAAQAKGKGLTDDEKWKLVNELMLKVSRENSHLGGLFHTTDTERVFQVPDAELPTYTVPADARTQIIAAFQQQGVSSPTETQIRNVYLRGAERFNRGAGN